MGLCANPGGLSGLCLLLLASVGPAMADPVTRTCDYEGPGKLGPLTVTADETAKRIVVTTALGSTWVLQDGVTTEYRPQQSDSRGYDVRTQFVAFKSDRVEVGVRNPDDGAMVHMSYFNRSALNSPTTRCLWKSLWGFRRV